MIISFFLYALGAMWSRLYELMPTGTLPSGASSAVQSAISWVWVINPIFDVPALFYVFGVYFTVEAVLWTAEMFVWIYSKVPIFGKGK